METESEDQSFTTESSDTERVCTHRHTASSQHIEQISSATKLYPVLGTNTTKVKEISPSLYPVHITWNSEPVFLEAVDFRNFGIDVENEAPVVPERDSRVCNVWSTTDARHFLVRSDSYQDDNAKRFSKSALCFCAGVETFILPPKCAPFSLIAHSKIKDQVSIAAARGDDKTVLSFGFAFPTNHPHSGCTSLIAYHLVPRKHAHSKPQFSELFDLPKKELIKRMKFAARVITGPQSFKNLLKRPVLLGNRGVDTHVSCGKTGMAGIRTLELWFDFSEHAQYVDSVRAKPIYKLTSNGSLVSDFGFFIERDEEERLLASIRIFRPNIHEIEQFGYIPEAQYIRDRMSYFSDHTSNLSHHRTAKSTSKDVKRLSRIAWKIQQDPSQKIDGLDLVGMTEALKKVKKRKHHHTTHRDDEKEEEEEMEGGRDKEEENERIKEILGAEFEHGQNSTSSGSEASRPAFDDVIHSEPAEGIVKPNLEPSFYDGEKLALRDVLKNASVA